MRLSLLTFVCLCVLTFAGCKDEEIAVGTYLKSPSYKFQANAETRWIDDEISLSLNFYNQSGELMQHESDVVRIPGDAEWQAEWDSEEDVFLLKTQFTELRFINQDGLFVLQKPDGVKRL